MARNYFDVDGDTPYGRGTFRDEPGDLFLNGHGGCRPVPRSISEYEDLVARNREIARIPFSWVT
jgi:hypothetical protein